MDPLPVLRDLVTSNQLGAVTEDGDHVDLGGRGRFERRAPTRWVSKAGGAYDLGSLLFYARALAAGTKWVPYYRAARAAGLAPVNFADKAALDAYLTGAAGAAEPAPELDLELLEQPAKRQRADGGGAAPAGAAGAAAAAAAAAAADPLADVFANEWRLRDLNSALSVPGRSFRRVLDVLRRASEAVAAEAAAAAAEAAAAAAAAEAAAKAVGPQPSGRYERQTAPDAGLQQMGAAELGLQAAAAGAPGGAPPPAPGAAAPAAAPPRPPKAPRAAPKAAPKAAPAAAAAPPPPEALGAPIILVPPAATALLNMLNARAFLEGGAFRPAAEVAAAGGERKEAVKFRRTTGRPGGGVPYVVTDREPRRAADWDRVVAVVCLGKAWQFKTWPADRFPGAAAGDLAATFDRVAGFFLHYADEPVDATVRGWRVRRLGVPRADRGRDASLAHEFWGALDAFLAERRCPLAY